MTVILKDLHHDDHFGIILFDGKVVHWNPSLTKATEENVAEAITYVKKIKDKGCEKQHTFEPFYLQAVYFYMNLSLCQKTCGHHDDLHTL